MKLKIFALAGLFILFSSLLLVGNAVAKQSKVSSYTVKNGDTLGTIAKKTGIPVKQIMALNNVRPSKLRIGRKLILSKPVKFAQKKAILPCKDCLAEEDENENEDEEEILSGNITLDVLDKANKKNEELLGKWNSPDERKLFIKVATGFLGAPYRFGGSTVRGIDCSSYVRKMYELFDITLPRTAREQSIIGVSIDRAELEEGDLVFFQTRKPIGHVGIYIGNNEFVHASRRSKVVRIDSLDLPYFQKRFRRATRVKGLDNYNKGV